MKMLQVTIRTGKFEEELAFYKEIVGLKIVRDLREKGRGIVFLADSEEHNVARSAARCVRQGDRAARERGRRDKFASGGGRWWKGHAWQGLGAEF